MITLISGAFAPGIALLSFIYLKDKYELEPLHLIIKMFIIGTILVFPAYVFERMIQEGLAHWNLPILSTAVVEEFLKWFILYFLIFKHVEFNEPYDGVVYSVAVSIGFATLENLGYLFFHSSQPAMILLRGLLPVSGHALFAIMMGYFLGKAKFSCIHYKKIFLFLSWIIPMIAHATYNFILEQKMMDWVYLMLPFLTFLWWYGLKKIKIATKLSPFHESEPPEVNY